MTTQAATDGKTYETGATTHAVNDLILYTDNTQTLAESRDSVYELFAPTHYLPKAANFKKLLEYATAKYVKEFGKDNSQHIINFSKEQKQEFCQLYADDFENWKKEHSIN